MITEKELQDIREEAEKLYPPPQNEGEGFERYFQTMTRIRQYQRHTYISALTRERERVKPVIAAANEMLHLHMCEQEGLQSGKPSFQQWCEAVDNLSNSLNNYKNNK